MLPDNEGWETNRREPAVPPNAVHRGPAAPPTDGQRGRLSALLSRRDGQRLLRRLRRDRRRGRRRAALDHPSPPATPEPSKRPAVLRALRRAGQGLRGPL